MGEAKSKRARFLAAHPYCCFCGGSEPATTVDHVPARTCFAERAGPQGFEFPACAQCQTASRQDEQVFGMIVKVSDPSTDNYRRDEVQNAIRGVRNNRPDLLPFRLSTRQKRQAIKSNGIVRPFGKAKSETPMFGFPPGIKGVINRYSRKIAAALYYREKGKAVLPDFIISSYWAFSKNTAHMAGFLEVSSWSPFQTVGSRGNLNFGNRFGYRFDMANDNDLFTAIAQFGEGLVIAMLVADGAAAKELDDEDGWVTVRDMFREDIASDCE